jgi:hypothetical protein
MTHPEPAGMDDAAVLDLLCHQLMSEHALHTVLLYGSRADGSAGPASDYDLAVYGPMAEPFRVARRVNGAYLDIWAYPEAELAASPGAEHLRFRGCRILMKRGVEAEALLARIETRFAQGPAPLPRGEAEARLVWAHKTLARARLGDPEGHYRRFELVQVLLEDYFQRRGLWFLGAKKSLRWLSQQDEPSYRLFCQALEPDAPIQAFDDLVQALVGAESP